MISFRSLSLCVLTFVSFANVSIAEDVLVRDTFSYPDFPSFTSQWQATGTGASISTDNFSLRLISSLAVKNFGPTNFIRSRQSWSLTCGMAQASAQSGQWIGLFTDDMCHGYIARWDTSATAGGSYSIYKYDSTSPITISNSSNSTQLATVTSAQGAPTPTPLNFQLTSAWDTTTDQRDLTLNVTDATNGTQTLLASVADGDTRVYTRVVLSGGANPASFSSLLLTCKPAVFNIVSYGAKGDGSTDDTVAINAAISAAQAVGGKVYIPPTSASYLYSSCLIITGIALFGDGDASLLQATDPHNSAIVLEGEHPALANIKITSPLASSVGRLTTPQSDGVVLYQASHFAVEYVDIDTTAGAGIISLGGHGMATSPALISHCKVANTLADGIHLTFQSRSIEVRNNVVTNSGDDMYAVVSYTEDGGLSHNINISGNTGNGQTNGRGISVVGGEYVNISNNNIQNTTGAGIYLQSELIRDANGALIYKTYGDYFINVRNNVLTNLASVVYHGGINLGGRPPDTTDAGQLETQPMLIRNVNITGNTLTNSHHAGMSLQGYFDGISIENNTIDSTAEQGLDVMGGADLLIGDRVGNVFKNIGSYGIYMGTNSYVATLTTGQVAITKNIFGDTNVLGTAPLPIISIGADSVTGPVSGNQFNVSGKYPISTPYIRYGVQ